MELTAHTYSLSPSNVTVVEHDDEDLGYVWFSEDSAGGGRYVGITRSFGDDSIHIERDDQRWQSYGGLTEVEFDGTVLTLHLTKSAAAALGGVESFVVDCRAVDLETRDRLQRLLPSLFADTAVHVQIARA